jgi:hypothetical protein
LPKLASTLGSFDFFISEKFRNQERDKKSAHWLEIFEHLSATTLKALYISFKPFTLCSRAATNVRHAPNKIPTRANAEL